MDRRVFLAVAAAGGLIPMPVVASAQPAGKAQSLLGRADQVTQ